MNPSEILGPLGGSKVFKGKYRTALDLVDLAERGLTKASLTRLATYLRLSMAEIVVLLPVTERTIQRRSAQEALSPVVSAQMLEIAQVAVRGVEAFGDKESFLAWLSRPSVALGNRTPFALLSTQIGIDLVLDELGRIEHGVVS